MEKYTLQAGDNEKVIAAVTERVRKQGIRNPIIQVTFRHYGWFDVTVNVWGGFGTAYLMAEIVDGEVQIQK